MSRRVVILCRIGAIVLFLAVCLAIAFSWNSLKIGFIGHRLFSDLKEKNGDSIAKPQLRMVPEGLLIKIDGNNISDYSPLAGINCLALEIANMKSQDSLDFLGTDLPVSDLYIKDMGDLKDISALKYAKLKLLALTAPNLTDISPIKDLPLEFLYLKSSRLSDFEPIENLSSLKFLYLYGNFSKIDFLEKLPQLESLTISSDNVSDFSVLKNLKNLKNLTITSKQLTDFSFLENLENITVLSLDGAEGLDYSQLKLSDKVTYFYHP